MLLRFRISSTSVSILSMRALILGNVMPISYTNFIRRYVTISA